MVGQPLYPLVPAGAIAAEETDGMDQGRHGMVIAADRYTDDTEKLRETVRRLDSDVKTVVLEEDGFLPDGILSPYGYFIYGQNEGDMEEKELYYNFLEVPEFWEIRTVDLHGAVYDMGCKKADIYFAESSDKMNVQRVEWCMENGWVYKIDYYNKYALKYASRFLDADGNVESRVFYSPKNQEVIVEQPQNDTVTLLEEGKMKQFFTSYADFMEYYLETIGADDKIALFVQDQESFGLWNLRSGGKSRWEYVLFGSDDLLRQYREAGGTDGFRFYAIPEAYPDNHANGEALILTSSDQLEGIGDLIRELPECTFHIAASTQVSDKLRKLGEQDNVKVYPQISMQALDALWERCDFYLDINHYWETYDAVDAAHQRNLLIMGFENTLHRRELLAEECIFSQAEQMSQAMKGLINREELVRARLAGQQRKKRELWEKHGVL